MNKKSVTVICSLCSVLYAGKPAYAATVQANNYQDLVTYMQNAETDIEIATDITFTGNLQLDTGGNSAATYAITPNGTTARILDGGGTYGGFYMPPAGSNIGIGPYITMQNFTSTGNGAAINADASGAINVDIEGGTTEAAFYQKNKSTGNGGAIYTNSTDGTATVDLYGHLKFLDNVSGGLGGAISIGGTTGAELTINSSGGAIRFQGNTDSTGRNDIHLASPNAKLNITGIHGEVVFDSGLSSADNTARINMTSGGSLLFGDNANYANFLGDFYQSNGTTNVYGAFIPGSAYISNNALFHLIGGPVDMNSISASSNARIDFRALAPGRFNSITVDDWISDGTPTLAINFDGLKSDVFTITNSSTGDANVKVTLLDFTADQQEIMDASITGIKVIDTSAAEDLGQNNSVFKLAGGVLDTGAWEYYLVQYDKSWYLTTTVPDPMVEAPFFVIPSPTNTALTISGLPTLHLAIAKFGSNELKKRLGVLRGDNPGKNVGVWARGYGQHLDIHEDLEGDLNLYGAEGGIDWMTTALNGRVYFGLMGGYLGTQDIRVQQTNGKNARGTASAPNVGAYLTWVHNSNSSNKWFVDLTARHFLIDNDMHNIASDNSGIEYDVQRKFYSASAEIGKLFYMNGPIDSYLSLEPKLEARYIYGEQTDFETNFGNNAHIDETHSLTGRAAMQLNYLGNGTQSVWKPFVEIGVANEFMNYTNVEFAGLDMHSLSVEGIILDASVGTNAQLSESAYMYGEFEFQESKIHTSYALNIGIRTKF